MKVFFDTSVLLAAFGPYRSTGNIPEIFRLPNVSRVTFEKCLFECYLAFRGVGGKKPDEGRQDWATRFLRKEGDPIPVGDSAGKLHKGSIHLAHIWVGNADEAQYALPETFDEYYENVRKYVREADWPMARVEWDSMQLIIQNHHRFQRLFVEFDAFLHECAIDVISYEALFLPATISHRMMVMGGLSKRSSIPSEDFEIAAAGLLSGADVFVSSDTRFLRASASIEGNIRRCWFVHFDNALESVQELKKKANQAL